MIPLIHYPWTTLRLALGIAMLTACAPASECELGKNADDSCRVLEVEPMALRSPAEYFNEHGEGVYFALPGAQIMSAGPLDDPYDIIVEPSGLPQILTLQPNGGLQGRAPISFSKAEWQSASSVVRLKNGPVFIASPVTRYLEETLARFPFDLTQTSPRTSSLSMFEEDGTLRWQSLVGHGGREVPEIAELPNGQLLAAGSFDRQRENAPDFWFLGDALQPELLVDDASHFVSLFDPDTGSRIKTLLLFGLRELQLGIQPDGAIELHAQRAADQAVRWRMEDGEEIELFEGEEFNGIFLFISPALEMKSAISKTLQRFADSSDSDAFVQSTFRRRRTMDGKHLERLTAGDRVGKFVAPTSEVHLFDPEKVEERTQWPLGGSLLANDTIHVAVSVFSEFDDPEARDAKNQLFKRLGYTVDELNTLVARGYEEALISFDLDGAVLAYDFCGPGMFYATSLIFDNGYSYFGGVYQSLRLNDTVECLKQGKLIDLDPKRYPVLEPASALEPDEELAVGFRFRFF